MKKLLFTVLEVLMAQKIKQHSRSSIKQIQEYAVKYFVPWIVNLLGVLFFFPLCFISISFYLTEPSSPEIIKTFFITFSILFLFGFLACSVACVRYSMKLKEIMATYESQEIPLTESHANTPLSPLLSQWQKEKDQIGNQKNNGYGKNYPSEEVGSNLYPTP